MFICINKHKKFYHPACNMRLSLLSHFKMETTKADNRKKLLRWNYEYSNQLKEIFTELHKLEPPVTEKLHDSILNDQFRDKICRDHSEKLGFNPRKFKVNY